jgi:elongation factor 2
MPRFKQIIEIQQLMKGKEDIRNIGIIAHIDHGKTTLADSLLAGAGLLSPKMAGSARVLDYLEEEQKRKITIKTANISLLHKTAEGNYVINLVDTPGHVDFTGKVTRALRAIDGAVVVVDGVEEIMAQTEVLTRQALEERVRPLLFINKVDRLITELRLSAEQIQEKFARIIGGFNDLVELYGEAPFKREWKVDAAENSVVFGSALHRWGFTLGTAQRKGVKFTDVIAAYKEGRHERLPKLLPVHDAFFELVVQNVPNPREAQRHRVEKIWKGNLNSQVGRAMTECSDSGPAVMCVTAVQADGTVATGRLFSGSVKAGDRLFMVNAQAGTLVKQVSLCMGSFREPVSHVAAGNLAAVTVADAVRAGETLVDAGHREGMVPFESIRYVSEPVVTVAVEPRNPQNLPEMLETMHKLAVEDPNIAVSVNKETGEYLLSGMGELHVEIALKQLREMGGEAGIKASSPMVIYRETVTRRGVAATASSPNKQNRFMVQVEPMEKELARLADEGRITGKMGFLAVDGEYKNVLMDCTGDAERILLVRDAVVSGFLFACGAGPLCGEPLRHVKATLTSVQLSEKEEFRDAFGLMRGVSKAVFGSFLTAKPVLLEPVYRTILSVPAELAGECSRIVGGRRGRIVSFEQKGALAVVTAFIPVSESFGLSQELRSTTSGRAFWQSMLDRWEQPPEKLAAKVIAEVRKRKGLPAEVPAADVFMEE